ncbi:MAG: flavodoxin family protein [Bacillota bacterium]
MVRVLGLNGSPRKKSTYCVIEKGLEAAAEIPGVETELLSLHGKDIRPCTGCGYCRKNKCGCVYRDDMQALIDRFILADAYLIGSPVYVHSITPQLMAFFSRLRPVTDLMPEKLRSKLGAAVAVGGTRNGGEEMAANQIIQLMMARGFNIVSGETRGYIGGKVWAQEYPGFTADQDEIGMNTVTTLAQKLAETAIIFKAGQEALGMYERTEE